jgi:hypothetical protein
LTSCEVRTPLVPDLHAEMRTTSDIGTLSAGPKGVLKLLYSV